MRTQSVETDVVVVGGGLAGVAAAVSAARLGRRVALIGNRPVLGGNSSSEVRVWVCGATAHGNQRWARETGVIGELYVENQYRNPEGNPIHWDDVVLDAVRAEDNIELFLNTDVREVAAHGPEEARVIDAVTGWTMGSEITTTFTAPVFLDCTGDGLVGHLAGARYRLGKEGRSEFGEDWAPEEPKREFLGSTLLFYSKDLGRPVDFVAPDSTIDITQTPIPESRIIRSGDSGAAYWWVEWGGELDIVDDNERIRDELRGVILGIWDYIKNSGRFDAETLDLEWIGNIPGKREYRRFIGDYTLHQGDIVGQTSFEDGVAFGGWSIDLHPAGGMYATGSGAVQRFSNGVFEIPYRSLYSQNVGNLLMAGRLVSATHIAFGAARVMATCAAMGEAAGTAAAIAVAESTTPRGVHDSHLARLRQTLLRQDATLIGVANDDPDDLARRATVTASSHTRSIATGEEGQPHPLADDLGIVVPVSEELGGLSLHLESTADTTLVVEAYLTDLPQNVIPVHRVAAASVPVMAGGARWIDVELPYAADRPRNVIVVVRADPAVTVFTTTQLPPGVLTLVHRVDNDDQNVEISRDELIVQWPTKPLRGRTVLFRAYPESAVLAPERATSGYSRPYDGPNMWASEPMSEGRDEWLRLDWDEPVTAREVRLVFDDDVDLELNTLHHHRSPDRVIPQLVRDYRVEVQSEAGWVVVAEVAGNRRRQRVHALPDDLGAFSAARLVISATNGAREARVIAFRVQR
ncbi:FAD-dependent oxidoreductase [Microbacterium sp. CIAB417]|uniref:FAD-dependent oxidoreductase n=1 Tax=Microbacterium sp. CIAB417 TaxID=2860287 RepID=UPI001FAE2CFE|nr:FAD-dependent oxidoreductase [Microbacterium sp. CIAB417]